MGLAKVRVRLSCQPIAKEPPRSNSVMPSVGGKTGDESLFFIAPPFMINASDR